MNSSYSGTSGNPGVITEENPCRIGRKKTSRGIRGWSPMEYVKPSRIQFLYVDSLL